MYHEVLACCVWAKEKATAANQRPSNKPATPQKFLHIFPIFPFTIKVPVTKSKSYYLRHNSRVYGERHKLSQQGYGPAMREQALQDYCNNSPPHNIWLCEFQVRFHLLWLTITLHGLALMHSKGQDISKFWSRWSRLWGYCWNRFDMLFQQPG